MKTMLKSGGALCVLALGLSSLAQFAYSAEPDAAAIHGWRRLMSQNATPGEGCFHASYPNTAWEKVDCAVGEPRVHPEHVKLPDGAAEVVGNGHDYVAFAKGLITNADGLFTTTDVKTESSVGVAAFGGGGILGSNEYSLQVNSNTLETTSACHGHSGCRVWQQFVYATDYIKRGEAAVFMQYWLINWGTSTCPSGWGKYGTDCFKNSVLAVAPDVPATELGTLELSANAAAGGEDSVTLYTASDSYTVTAGDGVLDISSVWNKAEFNVFGDAGGSRADFNKGASINVFLAVFDGSDAAPSCLANDGTTGETNNLNLGSCTASVGIFDVPYIDFTESD